MVLVMTEGSSRPAERARAMPSARLRDPRLDFFRGLAMFIILVAHIPGNPATNWIPARFGFSDATEMFVFCSGMASAIAFGAVFAERGWFLGAARIAYRVWQVYWAHIGLFIAVAATCVLLNRLALTDTDYVRQLNLTSFFDRTETRLVELLALAYVPNYFDILPMYLVILAMLPLVIALHRLSPWAAAGFVIAIWLGAQEGLWRLLGWEGAVLEFPSTHARGIEWFFNPFGWQLIFFAGFALMRGWMPAPPLRRGLILLAGGFVIFALLTASPRMRELLGTPSWLFFPNWPDALAWLTPKTDFGLFRFLHALSLGYLAYAFVGPGGIRLMPRESGAFAAPRAAALAAILKVGQQSLAIFLVSMWLARVLGLGFDLWGSGPGTAFALNALGFAILIAAAYGIAWFKSQPWRARKTPPPSEAVK
jgi:hypothetical protein